MLKLNSAPGWEKFIWPEESTGAARIKRCWNRAGTVGLPEDGAPRVAVAAAAPVVKAIVGGVAYPVPGEVIPAPVTPQV